jgi:hypothetical protein
MDEQRKYAILFSATILAARKLTEPASSRLAVPTSEMRTAARPRYLTDSAFTLWTSSLSGPCSPISWDD